MMELFLVKDIILIMMMIRRRFHFIFNPINYSNQRHLQTCNFNERKDHVKKFLKQIILSWHSFLLLEYFSLLRIILSISLEFFLSLLRISLFSLYLWILISEEKISYSRHKNSLGSRSRSLMMVFRWIIDRKTIAY